MASGSEELKLFIRQLGKLPPDIRQELRPRLKAIGQEALASVRAKASWSTRIPRATRLAVGLAKNRPGVSIVVSKAKAPHARPFEHGGEPGSFRHPVFKHPRKRDVVFGVERPGAFTGVFTRGPKKGQKKKGTVWVAQRARPFLMAGAEPYFERVDEQIGKAVDEVARKHGFK